MTCPKCGAQSRGDARFCGVCGAASSWTEPVSSPSLGEAPAMIGREIGGRYRMLAKLGEGGMGAVFRAEQISLKRTVAVKLLRPDVLGNQLLLRRFNAEAELVAKLSHPNTVNIYDFGQDADGTLFIAMEYIEGRSLRSVIHHEAPLAPRRALAIAQQVAASLADAHARGIVHRDLKPDNVMLQDRGREHDIARVLDFGIAKLRDDTRATQMQMTQQGDMLGTPQYMSPEQIRAEPVDGRTDIYALGCLLYEMVTARMPHDAPTVLAMLSKHLLDHPVPPSQRRPELALPPALDALILGAMAKDPGARPQTMEIVGEQIAAMLATMPAPRQVTGPAAVAPTALPGAPQTFSTPMAPSAFGPPAVARPAPPAHYPPSPYAPGPAGPSPGHPAYDPSRPPPGPATHHVRAARSKLPVIALAGGAIAVAAVVIGAVVLRSPSPSPAPGPGPAPGPHPVEPIKPAPPEPSPQPDPWAAPMAGTKVGVGQGVTVVLPPDFQATVQNNVTAAANARGIAIFAGPLAIATNDPMAIARYHAQQNHLVFESMITLHVAGAERPMLRFHGTFQGVAIRQYAVPVIGPGYRVGVVFQAPSKLIDSDNSINVMALDVFTQRIAVP